MLLRIDGFAGANKAIHPLLLPGSVGVDSVNQRPGRGDLRPWRAPATVASVPAGTQSIYRMGRDSATASSYWLAFSSDVDVARSFIADDAVERTYWTDGVAPKWTNNAIGLATPPYPTTTGVRLLGVPRPDMAPTVTVGTSGSGSDETRAFVTTWVNDQGEESQPSNPTTITAPSGSTLTVTRNASVPSGTYGITAWRVYSTVPGADATYYFLANVAAATPTWSFTGQTPNEPLPSLTWEMPPATLRGLKALWNGIMAGFKGKALRFCEPYRPFAWPIDYELIVDDTIVALAVYQQNLLVLTTGRPYLVTGSSPDAMSIEPLQLNQACVAKRGVVEFGYGVAWPSPDGLTYFGQGGPKLLTGGLFLREDWQAIVPSSLVACEYEGIYLGSYDPGTGRRTLMLDPMNPTGVYFGTPQFTACFRDPLLDTAFLLNGTNVQQWDAGSALTATFDTKTYRLPSPTSFAFAQVIADSYPVTLSLWVNGTQRLNAYSVTSSAPVRLPAGFRGDEWRARISTAGAVQAVLLAQSSTELQAI